MHIDIKPVADLTTDEGRGITRIIGEAFEPLSSADEVFDNYRRQMHGVMLGRQGREVVAFHFYQHLRIEGIPVFRFSLAAKLPGCSEGGVHRAMVRALLVRTAWRTNPLKPVAMAGVCNNPRTYRNAISVGGHNFPDVRDPSKRFPYRRLYRLAAEQLGIANLDLDTGLIENRGASVGLKLKADTVAPSDDPLFRGFVDYIGGDPNRGVFTMVVVRPIALALGAAFRRAAVFVS